MEIIFRINMTMIWDYLKMILDNSYKNENR